jgi:hypothetical protein
MRAGLYRAAASCQAHPRPQEKMRGRGCESDGVGGALAFVEGEAELCTDATDGRQVTLGMMNE